MNTHLDVDFENFSLSDERAHTIRNNIEKIKHTTWVEDLKTLVTEKGAEERLDDGSDDFLPGIVADSKPRVYRSDKFNDLRVTLYGTELRVKHGDTMLLEVAFLPKDKEFVLYYVNDEKWSELSDVFDVLLDEMKIAKKLKAERAAAFKAKFSK